MAGHGAELVAGLGAEAMAGRGAEAMAGRGAEAMAGRGAELVAGRGADAMAGRGAEAMAGRGAEAMAGRGAEVMAGRGAEVMAGRGAEAARQGQAIGHETDVMAAARHSLVRGSLLSAREQLPCELHTAWCDFTPSAKGVQCDQGVWSRSQPVGWSPIVTY